MKAKKLHKKIKKLEKRLKESTEIHRQHDIVTSFWMKKLVIYREIQYGIAALKSLEEPMKYSNSEHIDKTLNDINARSMVVEKMVETLMYPSLILEDKKKLKFAEED